MERTRQLTLVVTLIVGLFVIGASRVTAQQPSSHAEVGPKAEQSPSTTLKLVTESQPSRFKKMKLHWECHKSGGHWKLVARNASYDDSQKTYSETKTWACQAKK